MLSDYHDIVTVITPFQCDLTLLVEFLNDNKPLKKLCDGFCILKSVTQIFQVRRVQSVLIFSILMHLCCFIVDYYVLVFSYPSI